MVKNKPSVKVQNKQGDIVEIAAHAIRREDVKNHIKQYGPWGYPVKDWAVKHGVTERQIYTDIKVVLDHWDIEKQLLSTASVNSYAQNMKTLQLIAIDPKNSKAERMEAIRTMNQTVEAMTKFLEAWGYKEKVAERIEQRIRGENIHLMINGVNLNYPLVKKLQRDAEKAQNDINMSQNDEE